MRIVIQFPYPEGDRILHELKTCPQIGELLFVEGEPDSFRVVDVQHQLRRKLAEGSGREDVHSTWLDYIHTIVIVEKEN